METNGDPINVNQINSVDWFLRALVNAYNLSEGNYLGITLTVGGIVISGDLVSGDQYFSGIAEELRTAKFSSETVDAINSAGVIYKNLRNKKQDGDTNEEIIPANYIHLRNARIFHPGEEPLPINRGVWWRGKLESIDGFIIGAISSKNDPNNDG